MSPSSQSSKPSLWQARLARVRGIGLKDSVRVFGVFVGVAGFCAALIGCASAPVGVFNGGDAEVATIPESSGEASNVSDASLKESSASPDTGSRSSSVGVQSPMLSPQMISEGKFSIGLQGADKNTDKGSDKSSDKSIDKNLVLKLPHAFVQITGEKRRKTVDLRVDSLSKEQRCKLELSQSKQQLSLAEDVSFDRAWSSVKKMFSKLNKSPYDKSVSPCRYKVNLEVPSELNVDLSLATGTVSVEGLDGSLKIEAQSADLTLVTVRSARVECWQCNLTGEGVRGLLEYRLEAGNVGFTGVSGEVKGTTAGDTVLRLEKSDSPVHVTSLTGDITVFVPQGVSVSAELNAPRGNVTLTNVVPGSSGLKLTAQAEQGNVRLFREAKR